MLCRWSRPWMKWIRSWSHRAENPVSIERRGVVIPRSRVSLSSGLRSTAVISDGCRGAIRRGSTHGHREVCLPCRSRNRLTQGIEVPVAAGDFHEPRGSASPATRLCISRTGVTVWRNGTELYKSFPSSGSGWIGLQLQRTSTSFTYCSTIKRRTFRRPGGSNLPCSPWNMPWPDTSRPLYPPCGHGRP